jgi:hypothetical protein
MPIPVVPSYAPPRRSRSVVPLVVTVGATVLALLCLATTAVLLVTRDTAPAPPTVAVAPAVGAPVAEPVAAPVVAPVVAEEPGPALVDTHGDAVDAQLAAVVTRVYRAIDANDREAVRKAYSAGGSDDWYTSGPHLRSATVRNRVLAALRERPSAHDGYLYASGSYTVQFGQRDRYAPPGLLTIWGPWSTAPSTSSGGGSSWSAPSTATSAPTDCGGGSVAVPTEDHPCQDPETGRGVDRDGTVGVHGLKPCPFGTEVPSDPDEPTRNAGTGEVCGLY